MPTPATPKPYACRGCDGDLAGLVDQTCPTCKAQLVDALDGDLRDELAAAGSIIAALVRQLDSHGAIVPHLPNVSPGQQSAAIRMLAGVGLDCNGRRVA